ncbi:MAG: methyltransferase domain-containing protein [Planctomycetaceae bacterium]|nr:methyltransferase domain-containing protein [Planctomycetaceae bacterium]
MNSQYGYSNPVCPICRSEDYRFFCLNDSRPLKRCDDCDFVYAAEIPAEGAILQEYQEAAHKARRTGLQLKRRLSYRLEVGLVKMFLHRRREIRTLHVNFGDGLLLQQLDGHPGYDAMGVELSPQSLDPARNKLLDVYHSSVEEMSFRDQIFDFIHAADRPEVFYNPERTCLEMQRILAPGGLIFLSLPRMRKLPDILRGESWGERMTDQLWHFTTENAALFLQRLGFRTHFVRQAQNGSSVFVIAGKQPNANWDEIPRWVGIQDETDQPSWSPEIRRVA